MFSGVLHGPGFFALARGRFRGQRTSWIRDRVEVVKKRCRQRRPRCGAKRVFPAVLPRASRCRGVVERGCHEGEFRSRRDSVTRPGRVSAGLH